MNIISAKVVHRSVKCRLRNEGGMDLCDAMKRLSFLTCTYRYRGRACAVFQTSPCSSAAQCLFSPLCIASGDWSVSPFQPADACRDGWAVTVPAQTSNSLPPTHVLFIGDDAARYQALLYMYAVHFQHSNGTVAACGGAGAGGSAPVLPPVECLPTVGVSATFEKWQRCIGGVTAALGDESLRCDCPFIDQSADVSYENLYYRGQGIVSGGGGGVAVTFLRVGTRPGRFLGIHTPAGWLPRTLRPRPEELPPDDAALQFGGHDVSKMVDGVLTQLGCVDDVVLGLTPKSPLYGLDGRRPNDERMDFLRHFQRLLCSNSGGRKSGEVATAQRNSSDDGGTTGKFRTPVWLTGVQHLQATHAAADWSGVDVAVALGWRVLDRGSISRALHSGLHGAGCTVAGQSTHRHDGSLRERQLQVEDDLDGCRLQPRQTVSLADLFRGWHAVLVNILRSEDVMDTLSASLIPSPDPATLRPVEPLPGILANADNPNHESTLFDSPPGNDSEPSPGRASSSLAYPPHIRWSRECLYSDTAMQHGHWVGRVNAFDGEADVLRYSPPHECGAVALGMNLSEVAAALSGRHLLFLGDSVLRYQVDNASHNPDEACDLRFFF